MSEEEYIQPVSCEKDRRYYLKTGTHGRELEYQEVRFIAYRPHPAEVIIDDGDKIRMVHRAYLFLRVSGNGKRN